MKYVGGGLMQAVTQDDVVPFSPIGLIVIAGTRALFGYVFFLISLVMLETRPFGFFELVLLTLSTSAWIWFSLTIVWAVLRLVDRRPALLFTATGLIDNASLLSAGHLSWNEITGATYRFVRKPRSVLIYVRDPKAVLDRQSLAKRLIMRLKWLIVGTPVSIWVTGIPTSGDELASRISTRLRSAK